MNDNLFICKICGQTFKSFDPIGLHLSRKHKISTKDYYDMFYKRPDEGKCKTCGNDTPFMKLHLGYRTFCSKSCVSRNKEIQKQKEETLNEHYGQDRSIIQEKIKSTNKEKYGYEWATQSPAVKEKTRNTEVKKYNGHHTHLASIKKKTKETCLQNLGVEYAMQSTMVQEKSRKTCFKHYGTEFPMQNHEIFSKSKKHLIYDGITFHSSWELIYYKYLVTNDIPFEYQPNVSFTYFTADGKSHKYFPDFKVNETFVEIKGLQFFENKDPTQRMINPFNRLLDDAAEAKHQCMINNDIMIITDITPYKEKEYECFNCENDDCQI